MILLHGTLHVTIYEVERFSEEGCCNLFCKLLPLEKDVSKLYVTIDLDKVRVGRTRLLERTNKSSYIKWNESFHIYCAHKASNVAFSIEEEMPIGAAVVGRAFIPAEELINGKEVEKWLKIVDKRHKSVHRDSQIHVRVKFSHVTTSSNWSQGIKSPKFPGVPYTFFPQRNGCRVTLYQDAHTSDEFIPKIPLAGGKYYEAEGCWEDIFDAVNNAKHLVYIAGWSVYTEITLIRDLRREKSGSSLTLGELLVKKAKEGVAVLMLIWDDRTSVKLLKKDGVMVTHGVNTEAYFHDTGVHCVLCPRNPDNLHSIIQDIEIATMFTHHQKLVVVDSEMPNQGSEKRRIVSFIGGLDLCDGRYDTPFHSLFRTLNTVHHDDFHQPCLQGAEIEKGGPREPWHDSHCRLEGPVAWDVLFNFEQRWKKQGGKKDLLVELTDDTFIPPSPVMFPDDHETWNVQLFRSIDGGAALGFPATPDAARAGLVSGKDHIIDHGVQDAYINAIRRAKNFIYIENQYFIGSSFSWDSKEDVGAWHLIPKELSLKIISKIKAGERFTVYIVLPMWPEGVPHSQSVQVMLNWHKKTMEMMYVDITEALKAKGLDTDPKEYLTFFCLGNRETKKGWEYQPSEKPELNSDYYKAQTSRRFMIYVHSKLMIGKSARGSPRGTNLRPRAVLTSKSTTCASLVDDEYIIIGSANINQRSMDGARDTEIVMGAYQPYHLTNNRISARGRVHGLRMALWYEHIGRLDEAFLQPESLECVEKVNQIGKDYWELYSQEALLEHDLPGHLLSYPIGVASNGEVVELPGFHHFPDTEAKVLGSTSDIIPSIMTT